MYFIHIAAILEISCHQQVRPRNMAQGKLRGKNNHLASKPCLKHIFFKGTFSTKIFHISIIPSNDECVCTMGRYANIY
jgi:hypothetical protein